MSKEQIPEKDSVREAHLMLFILANVDLLRMEVLDRTEIDRDAIVTHANNIEWQVMELAQRILGVDISEWQAKQERKREQP